MQNMIFPINTTTRFFKTLVFTVHYIDVIMSAMVSQITNFTIVYSTVYSGVDQRKHQNSASLAFVWRIHRWPVNSPHKGPVTRKLFPFDDVIIPVMVRWFHDDAKIITWCDSWKRISSLGPKASINWQIDSPHRPPTACNFLRCNTITYIPSQSPPRGYS